MRVPIPPWKTRGRPCGNPVDECAFVPSCGQKNKGAGSAPESRKYLGMNVLEKGTYFFPFFAFFVLFFAAFFLAGMDSVTSSLAGFVDSAGSCVLAWPPLEGRGLALPDSVDCLESPSGVDRFQKTWFPWDGIVLHHGAVPFFFLCGIVSTAYAANQEFFS